LTLEYSYALAAAAKGGHLDIVHLLERVLVDATSWTLSDIPGTGETMLWEAARFGHQDVVHALLDRGVRVNAVPDPVVHGVIGAAIQQAAKVGNADMVRLLSARGASMTPASRYFRHTVEAAAQGGHEEAVDVLVELGSDPRRALCKAAANGQAGLLRRLVERHPNLLAMKPPNSDSPGHTLGVKALELAIFYPNPAVVSVLVEFGVSLDEPTTNGDLPVDYAKKNSKRWMLEALLSMGATDTEFVGEYHESFETETEGGGHPLNGTHRQGRVYVTKRTWEWIGKY
jgi:ankyrin repeat protein